VGFVCRVIVFAEQMQADFLLKWFGSKDMDWAITLLKEIMSKDLRANLKICVQVYIIIHTNRTSILNSCALSLSLSSPSLPSDTINACTYSIITL
jgi:hypothetical protein